MKALLILIYIEAIGMVVFPFLFGFLRGRGFIPSEKLFAFMLAANLTILVFTTNVYSVYLLIPSDVSRLRGWLVVISLSLITWLFTYPLSRWLYRNFIK